MNNQVFIKPEELWTPEDKELVEIEYINTSKILEMYKEYLTEDQINKIKSMHNPTIYRPKVSFIREDSMTKIEDVERVLVRALPDGTLYAEYYGKALPPIEVEIKFEK